MKHVVISDSLHGKLVERKKIEGPAIHLLAERYIKLGLAAEKNLTKKSVASYGKGVKS